MNIPKIWVKAEREVRGKRGPMRLVAWGWVREQVEPILKLHDEITKASASLPLA